MCVLYVLGILEWIQAESVPGGSNCGWNMLILLHLYAFYIVLLFAYKAKEMIQTYKKNASGLNYLSYSKKKRQIFRLVFFCINR